MSLKAFHIVFIIAATLLAFGMGVWELVSYFDHNGGGMDLALGIGSALAGMALLVYGKMFLKKLRHVSYL